MSLDRGVRLGPYEILEQIGSGGMGEVYRALDSRLGREVAVKIVPEAVAADPEAMARFGREARTVAALSHPNIVSLFDVGTHEGVSYAVLELLEGQTLRARMAEGPLPLQEALSIAAAIADGLAAAHRRGIVHRDLKPENVFLTVTSGVKILDFGIAKSNTPIDSNTKTDLTTEPGTVLGTVGYSSPEQLRGRPPAATSDLFSLGCVLYEMIRGSAPFERHSRVDTIAAILHEDPDLEDLPVPPAVRPIIDRLLQKRAGDRYGSAAAVATVLRDVLRPDTAPTALLAAQVEEVFHRGRARRLAGYVIAAAIPLALLALLTRGKHDQRAATPAITSVAVLPIVNSSGAIEDDYLADGLTETLIHDLAKLNGPRVMSRTSVFRFKGRNADVAEIRSRLGVDAAVFGKLARRGTGVTIDVELVRTADGSRIWGTRQTRPASDVVSMQRSISAGIAQALGIRPAAAPSRALTVDNAAYLAYLKGRHHWNRRTREGLATSIRFFEDALEKDASFALAYSGLADAYVLFPEYDVMPAVTAYPRARAAAERALEIEPGLAEAHAALAYARIGFSWDWEGAEREFREAIRLNPNAATVRHWFGLSLLFQKRFGESIAELETARQLDPLSLIIRVALGLARMHGGDLDGAEEQFREALEIEATFWPAYWASGELELRRMRGEAALKNYTRAVELSNRSPANLSELAFTYALLGRPDNARALRDELQRESGVSPDYLAGIASGLGEHDQAFLLLERAVAERAPLLRWFQIHPMFDPLRHDARYRVVLRQLNFKP